MVLKPNLNDREFNKFKETPSGKHAVRVCLDDDSQPIDVAVSPVGTPVIVNLVSPATSNTEFSHTLSVNTKRFQIKSRDKATIKFSFSIGGTTTNYWKIKPGFIYSVDSLTLSAGLVLYMSVNKISDTIEIFSWE